MRIAALLCLALLSACRPPGALTAPTSVPSVLGPVPIVYVDTIVAADSSRMLVGGYDWYARRILIRREALRSPATAHLIAAHEWCHVILVDAGLRFDPVSLELLCDVLAQARVAELLKRKR